MAFTATLSLFPYPKGVDNTQRATYARGTVAFTSGTYATGGVALNWDFDAGLKVIGNPYQVTFFSEAYAYNATASLLIGGYEYIWNAETNKLQIMTPSGGTASTGPLYEEMANSTTIPPAVLNDTIAFEAVFVKSGAF